MRIFKILAAAALAMPAIAVAQVGPNPAVSGGSQDPTMGGSTDTMTAPQDAGIGQGPTGNVLDRSIDTPARPATDGSISTEANATAGTGTSATAGTKTRTKSATKPMKKPRQP